MHSLNVLSKTFTIRAKHDISLFLSFPGRTTYRYIGLYRPPPGRMLGRPIRTYKSRLFARKRCEKIAKYGRYRAYALRYGRYCYVTRLTSRKFTRYGRSRTRRPSALQVFVRTSGMFSNITNSIRSSILRYRLIFPRVLRLVSYYQNLVKTFSI